MSDAQRGDALSAGAPLRGVREPGAGRLFPGWSVRVAVVWVVVVAWLGVLAPFIACGHPWRLDFLDQAGKVVSTRSPMRDAIVPLDWLMLAWAAGSSLWIVRGGRARGAGRAAITLVVGAALILVSSMTGLDACSKPQVFDSSERIARGEARAWFAPIPWSPSERAGDRDASMLLPGSWSDQALARLARDAREPGAPVSAERLEALRAAFDRAPLESRFRGAVREVLDRAGAEGDSTSSLALERALSRALEGSGRRHWIGTDRSGQDVLARMLHACRLALFVGLVSTGLSMSIGVTLGALMGYFGGLVDLLLYRVVEVFMSIPLLFILVAASGVLPRNTLVLMAIIGCFTWMNAARYTRAEFLRLRGQDFILAARASAIPFRSLLFRHMLSNGAAPVLVEASFAVALAIVLESTLSFLGLGPPEQASWGGLLASGVSDAGTVAWWIVLIPGSAIFLSALACNVLGDWTRARFDPKQWVRSA